jgi:hypothetical protein
MNLASLAAAKKDSTPYVVKLADLIEKNDEAGAKKQAATIADEFEDLDKVMRLFKIRGPKGKGLGIGPARNKIKPDGIELKLLDLAKGPLPAGKLAKEADALVKTGYHIAAIAEVAHAKAPTHPKKQDWLDWSSDLKKAGIDLAKAAKDKDAKGITAAATKANASCASCHMIFRKND